MSNDMKIVIIAGPNGAGKTTFAREFLPNEGHCPTFINADLIAAGISPFAPESVSIRAGRLMLEEIEDRVHHRKSFAFETTLSGRAYLHKIREWQKLGYHVKLIFLSLPDVDVAIAR
jgi:predicted ABC-type ATPase